MSKMFATEHALFRLCGLHSAKVDTKSTMLKVETHRIGAHFRDRVLGCRGDGVA